MRTTKMQIAATAAALALAVGAASCSSGGSEAGSTTTKATAPRSTSTTAGATTTAKPTTTAGATTTVASGGLPPCDVLLQEYTDAFDLDDLRPAAALFRQWAPEMPADVGAAVLRIADAWDAVDGDGAQLDMADQAMTADAQAFSDWTAAGCPTS